MISLIHPSRGRPQKAKDTYERWVSKSYALRQYGKIDFEHILVVDSSDPKKDEYEGAYIGDHESVVHATNVGVRMANHDILLYLSDDFDCPDNWDLLIQLEFRDFKGPALLKVDDCLQNFHTRVLTIPIMNRAFYERVGYFWNPLYKSMFVDEDLYWTAVKLEALRFAPHLKFPHNHVSVGKADNDDTYRRSAANWDQGKATFARRKAAGFPL
jgi:hypothetical protein